LESLDEKLEAYGGARSVILGLDNRNLPARAISEEIKRITGVSVTEQTIRNWLRKWPQGEEALTA
jgi:transposase-like protein